MTDNEPGYYKRVGNKSGPLAIGGAEKRMEKDSTFTYDPMHKVAAPLDELEEFLNKNFKKEKKEALRGAYNKQNLDKKEIRDAFEREIENAMEERQVKHQITQRRLNCDLGTVISLAKWRREDKRDEKDEKASSKPVASRNLSFKDRVKALKGENKVWDVTNMDENGHKGRKMEWKSSLDRRRMSTDRKDRFYYIIYNPKSETRIEGVRHFMQNYGGFEEGQIRHVLDQVESGGKVKFSPGRSPVSSSPMLSPKNRKKEKKEKKSNEKKEKSVDKKEKKSKEKDKKAKKEKKSSEKKDVKKKSRVDVSDESEDDQDDEMFDDLTDDE
jgi:hypothetical protein